MIGIVAEYNPYHLGHSYLIAASELILDRHDTVVSVMSGDFVQRGEPAVLNKFERAKRAVEGGVDLVVELPLPWCLSSAEGFARGAVSILRRMGCDVLAFGSECGDIEKLKVDVDYGRVSRYMHEHPESTFAAAVRAVTGNDVFDGPNNILGIEYLKFCGDMTPITVKRTNPHDGPGSAKEIRASMKIPDLDREIVSRLRMFDRDYFSSIPDSDNGLGNRLYDAVSESADFSEILKRAKTKSFTMSRVRRLAMNSVLGVTKGMSDGEPPYARVLAFNDKGREVLRGNCDIPVIVKPSEIAKLGEDAQNMFAIGASAHDFYMLSDSSGEPKTRGNDYRTGPFCVL